MTSRVFDFQKPPGAGSSVSGNTFNLNNDRSNREQSGMQRPGFQHDFNLSAPTKESNQKSSPDFGNLAKPAPSLNPTKSNHPSFSKLSGSKFQVGAGMKRP
jgi:hypothetical protein